MEHIYTSIDIGSNSIKVAVCQLFNNKLNLLAATSVKSRGIKNGLIIDSELASNSIKLALSEVEDMLGLEIKKIIASIPSNGTDFTLVKGRIKLNENVIEGKDVTNVLNNAIRNADLGTKEIVNIIPIDFGLDDKIVMADPKGKTGSVLSVRAIVASVPKKNIYSVLKVLESIGLEVVDISLNSIGDIYALRTKEHLNNVGAIINIGYETTNVSLYNKGIIIKNSVLNIGSSSIDSDISYIYKLDINDSIKLKEKFALAHKRFASKNDFYELTNKYNEKVRINQFELSEIIMSKIEEILIMARKEINLLTKSGVDYIIVTGGTSSMDNFDIITEEVLGNSSNVGNVKILGVRNNKYSSVVGNIIYFINKLRLKGIDYTMINEDELEEIDNKKNIINVINETMLGKVFSYFFND